MTERRIDVGAVYLTYNRSCPESYWQFLIVAEFVDADGAKWYVGIKNQTEPGFAYTHIFGADGVEADHVTFEEPFRLGEKSKAKPRYRLTQPRE